jgi:hypothetical protein
MWDHDYGMQTEAADRIEKLEAVLEVATMKRIINTDRIEKLEAALREVCKNWDSPIFESDWEALVELWGVFNERKQIARKALEGKDD